VSLCFFKQHVVDVDVAELVFDDRDLQAVASGTQDVIHQRGFPRTQVPGEDRDGDARVVCGRHGCWCEKQVCVS